VNEDLFTPADWIFQPDLSAVSGVPNKYWLITGDNVSEMNPGQKNAIDNAIKEARRQAAEDLLDQVSDIQVAFNLLVFDEINILRLAAGLSERTIPQLKLALRNKLVVV
jgi:hypothetical protein